VVSANRVEASVWMEGECGGQNTWRETVRDRRNSNRCACQTQEDIHVSEVGGRRASIRLTNGQYKTKQSDRKS
jgi:hypothetical protein